MINSSNKAKGLFAKICIFRDDQCLIRIGGTNEPAIITELNFYTRLNSFAMNADATIEDTDNKLLNAVLEPNVLRVMIEMFEIPDMSAPIQPLTSTKVFAKLFSIDEVVVLSYSGNYPYRSKFKLKLVDINESLILNKILHFSNFHLDWDSKEMEIEPTMHSILKDYEKAVGSKLVVQKEIFGVPDLTLLKRRIATDCNTSMQDVFHHYIDSLYDIRWREFLTNSQLKMAMPECMLAYGNQYILDKNGLKSIPWITTMNIIENDPGTYCIPYGGNTDYAMEKYNIFLEDLSVDLRGGPNATMRENLLSLAYRMRAFDPKLGFFEDQIVSLDQITQLIPKVNVDIMSKQDWLGVKNPPQFSQPNVYDKQKLLKNPFSIKENHYYFQNGDGSFYQDMCNLIYHPTVYVTIPFAAWHSPGQVIDLRMATKDYDRFKPDKNHYWSWNKLISGRWKIMNSVSTFKLDVETPGQFALTPCETVGLTRTKYWQGKQPETT